MNHHDEPARISVSRDALRADLAELKLDLLKAIHDAVASKADKGLVESIDKRLQGLAQNVVLREGPIVSRLTEYEAKVDAHERGELTDAQLRRIEDVIEDIIVGRGDRGWTTKQRVIGIVAVCISALALIVSAYVAFGRSSYAPSPSIFPTETGK